MLQPQPLLGKSGFEILRLSCKVYGDPVPTITWSVKTNGRIAGRYTISDNSGSSNMTLFQITSADEGVYACLATNSFGTIFAEINVRFNSKLFTFP